LPSLRNIKYQRSLQRENLRNYSTDPVAEFVSYGLREKKLFVRNYQVLPSLCAVLAADNQINDIVNFCTDPTEFTILSIDTTYNVCENLYVTPLTYKHLRLIDKRTVLPGSAMMHSGLGADTFKYFGETLVRHNSKLQDILAVGSDRDTAIDNGFMASFPIGRLLACKRHVEGNIKKTLSDIGITAKCQHPFLEEIFGNERTKVKVIFLYLVILIY